MFRAIRAAILNPTNARMFIKHGEKQCAVGLKIPNLPPILYGRSQDQVFYKVDGDVKTKLGRGTLHDQIKDLPFPVEEETGRLMNFHTEHDVQFPYNYSPSELL